MQFPIDFSFDNDAGVNTIFSMGGNSEYKLSITNTSNSTININKSNQEVGKDAYHFALKFRPGTLKNVDNSVVLTEDSAKDWKLNIDKQASGIVTCYLLSQNDLVIKSSENIPEITFKNVIGDSRGGSHATQMELRYNVLLAGKTIENSRLQHLQIIHHYPVDIDQLEQALEPEKLADGSLVTKRLTEVIESQVNMRDQLIPPLKVKVDDAWNLVECGGSTTLNLHLVLSDLLKSENKKITLTENTQLFFYTDDKNLSLSDISVDLKTFIWKSIPEGQSTKDKLGIQLANRNDLTEDNSISLSINLEDKKTISRICKLYIKCLNIGEYEDFTLELPINVGPFIVENNTVGLKGDLALTNKYAESDEKRLKLFEDRGWNFTLTDPEADENDVGFRIGPSDGKAEANNMSYFVVRRKGQNGQVGIGTFDPQADLHIKNSNSREKLKLGEKIALEVSDSELNINNANVLKVSNGRIEDEKGPVMPKGAIIMWSGSTIPQGWVLCDGRDSTPNLVDRFIVGAGNEYSVGSQGGQKEVTLSVGQMPRHSHGVNDPGHSHTTESEYVVFNSDRWSNSTGEDGKSDGDNRVKTAKTGITIQESGSSYPHENRPPYYALCFIMKT